MLLFKQFYRVRESPRAFEKYKRSSLKTKIEGANTEQLLKDVLG